MQDSNKFSRRQFIAGSVSTVLDPDRVRAFAFNHYFRKGCMHGGSADLMQSFR